MFPNGDQFTVNLPPPPVSEIGAGFLPLDPINNNPLNLNQRTLSAFTPTNSLPAHLQSSTSNHFHPIQPSSQSHVQNPNNSFNKPLFPVEFPMQNSVSYKPENNHSYPIGHPMNPQHPFQTGRNTGHDIREPRHDHRDPRHDSRDARHVPRDPRDSRHDPRDSRHDPRDSRHDPRDPRHDQRDMIQDPRHGHTSRHPYRPHQYPPYP